MAEQVPAGHRGAIAAGRLTAGAGRAHRPMPDLEILRRRIRGGFRSFTLRLADGRRLPAPHPEFISVGRNVVLVVDADDLPHHVDPLHIVSIEDHSPLVQA